MKATYLFELKKELNSARALIIGAVFILISYLVANYSTKLSAITLVENGSAAVNVLFVLYAILGFLFSSVLFSGMICQEVTSQRIRYVVPYLSRSKLYLTKFAVAISYFLIIISLSILVLFLFGKISTIPLREMVSILVFFANVEALTLLISSIFNRERFASLVSLILGLVLPFVYLLSTVVKGNLILNWVSWLLPYKYLDWSWQILISLLIALGYLFTGIQVFKAKEL